LLFRAAPVAFWSIGGNTLKPNRSINQIVAKMLD